MGRLEQRIMAINDRLAELAEEERLVTEELSYHRHINDDAQRDAAVGNAEDRAFAADSSSDVARFEKAVREVVRRRSKLEGKRQRLLDRLT